MTFEQRYGAEPPMGEGPLSAERKAYLRWHDRKTVWIKAQMEMRERASEVPNRHSLLDWVGGSTGNAVGTAENIAHAIRALEPE